VERTLFYYNRKTQRRFPPRGRKTKPILSDKKPLHLKRRGKDPRCKAGQRGEKKRGVKALLS